MSDRYLRIYLNDQLALGIAGRELARRSARANAGSETGAVLEEVARQVTADVLTLEGIMQQLGAPRSRVKPLLAALGERAGRLKLNGSLREYSPLSRFLELDFLLIGLDAKRQLWETLRDLAALPARLPGIDFDELIARAGGQRALLEPSWVLAGHVALGELG
jgi:hypothetical protein